MVLILAMGLSGMLEFFTMARYRVLIAADQRTYVVSLASMSSLMLSTALIVVLPYLGMDVIVAVSYTHLEVYKRQVHKISVASSDGMGRIAERLRSRAFSFFAFFII